MTNKQTELYLKYHKSKDIQERYEIAKSIIVLNKKYPIPRYWAIEDLKSIKCENWRPLNIPGFENFFQISTLGRFKRLFRTVGYRNGTPKRWEERILVPHKLKQDILRHRLYVNNVDQSVTIHRAMAFTYIENPENKPTVNHIDGDRLNNHVLNLEWATWGENERHSYRVLGKKTDNAPRGEKNKFWKGEISQYTKEGIFIRTFNSVSEAINLGAGTCHIGSVINGKRKSDNGFIWKR